MSVRLPFSVKIPAVVIAFMAMVAVFASERVLTRLGESQSRHLGDLATVYLDGLASALDGPVVREDVWEVFDILDRARQSHVGLRPTLTIVANSEGRVLASSDPRAIPSWSALPASFLAERTTAPTVAARDTEARAVARRDLSSGGRSVGAVHASFDIEPLLAERRSVLWTLVGTNAALTVALALIASLTVRRMMQPLGVLTSHLKAGVEGPVEPIPHIVIARAPDEFRRLFAAFNGLAQAVRDREGLSQQLAEEERLAGLGRLASGMAHEINNPLGGLFNALDTLRAHGGRLDVRTRTVDLIDRGLRGIRDVVRTALVTYRADRKNRSLKPDDIDDLQVLIGPEIHRKELTLRWANGRFGEIAVPACVVRQILLNLLLNACRATPPGGEVALVADVKGDTFVATVEDGGPGLSGGGRDILEGADDRLPAPSQMGTGLGLWIVRRLLNDVSGTATVTRRVPTGTVVLIAIPLQDAGEALANVA